MSATPLYFIPGAMCDERLWLPVIEYLNTSSPPKYRCELLAIPKTDDLNTAISELLATINLTGGNQPCHIIGFSLGGYLAASLAAKHPKRVAKLFLVSSMPSVLSERLTKERRRTVAFLSKHGYKGVSIERAKALVDNSQHENEDLLTLIQTMDHQSGGQTLIQQLKLTMQRENVLEKLHLHQLPVRFSVGECDIKVDVEVLTQLVHHYGNMDLMITPSIGHMFPLEAPSVVAQQIQQWFN